MRQTLTALLVRESEIQFMLDHVRSLPTEEVCGLLAGTGNEIRRVIRVENVLHSPYRYRMEPRAQVQAIETIEDSGFSLVGIYHSHPRGPSGLSSQDLREAAYPEAAYLVWSSTGVDWECRAFRLEGEQAKEIAVVQTQSGESAMDAQQLSLG
jgi:proteasome lid subunit RPN8/RPN11